MNSDEVKAAVLCYWRYEKQCPLVALEADWDSADIIAVTKNGRKIETEVKVSIGDFRADAAKQKHHLWTTPDAKHRTWQFWFAVPRDLANQVAMECEQRYPYAGVLGVGGESGIYISAAMPFPVTVYRKARHLSQQRIPLQQMARLVRDQSATVCRLAKRCMLTR